MAIADALPARLVRVHCAGDLPESRLLAPPAPRTLVLHRPLLTAHDADFLARLREADDKPTHVVLCAGPHVRHVDLERWSPLYDALVPEATARDAIGRHVRHESEAPARPGFRPRLSVVSSNFELRHALGDACQAAGYPATPAADWSEASPGGLALWDVPVLDPAWPSLLARRTPKSHVVALFGFADRAIVGEARSRGASACLELPCDLDDLVYVLDRLAIARGQASHDVPPPPASLRRPNRPVVVSTPEE